MALKSATAPSVEPRDFNPFSQESGLPFPLLPKLSNVLSISHESPKSSLKYELNSVLLWIR